MKLSSMLLLSTVLSSVQGVSVFENITSAISSILSGILLAEAPVITLEYGTFRGVADSVTGTDNFLGIPFGIAPRFDQSYLFNTTLTGTQDAGHYGYACPQQELVTELEPHDAKLGAMLALAELAVLPSILEQSEDCLNVNVQRPYNTSANAKLPVLLWIHGGAYSDGASAAFAGETTAAPGVFYNGGKIVQRSVEVDTPIVFVSANYRLNAFGLSGGAEIEAAGVANLAIEDQRLAMRWVQKYISQFGGDPGRVTIMGESAGSWSVSSHLVVNDGDNEGLFHGVIAMSGGPQIVEGQARAQPVFDAMAVKAGCDSAADKLTCLRTAPFEKIFAAVQEQPIAIGYNSLALTWTPRPAGKLLSASPHDLVSQGKIAKVPVIIGDMKDEGTLFSLITQLNVTTDAGFKEYFKTIWWPSASDAQLDQLMTLYPNDATQGSPYDTGILNAITPQYKRLASLIGDYSFQSQRRHLIDHIPVGQNVWTYQIETTVPVLGDIPLFNQLGLANLPAVGSCHISDAFLYTFGTLPTSTCQNTRNILGTIISFVNTHDPNNHGLNLPHWPTYDTKAKDMYHFSESGPTVIQDTARKEAMQYINDNAASFGI